MELMRWYMYEVHYIHCAVPCADVVTRYTCIYIYMQSWRLPMGEFILGVYLNQAYICVICLGVFMCKVSC